MFELHVVKNFFKFPEAQISSESAKLIWLVRWRWVAVGLFFLMASPGYFWGTLSRETFIIFIGVLSLLLIFNLLTHFFFIESKRQVGPLFICLQLSVDLMVLTALLFLSGGFANPFVVLFLFNAGLGGILIRGKLSWPFILLCHSFLICLQTQYFIKTPMGEDHPFLMFTIVSHVLLFAIWLLMRSLGASLENYFEISAQARMALETQNRLRAIGALAAGFSHEFASPLNAAKLRLDRVVRGFDKNEKVQSWMEDILEAQISIRSCEAVIHSMNASQLDVREYHLKEIKVAELIYDVIEAWKYENPNSRIEVVVNSNQSFLVSPINLAQVILNLLDNAFEASPGSLIRVELSVDNGQVILKIEDHGPGFCQHVLSRRGEPFLTTKPNGTGLGLYVSDIFAQSLGGQISIANKANKSGAVVTLSWPG